MCQREWFLKKLLFSIPAILILLLTSCIPEDEISRRVSGTLTALPSPTNLPTYTYYPTATIQTPTITPTIDYSGIRFWKNIPVTSDAFNIIIKNNNYEEGTLDYQSFYLHDEIKSYYISEMPNYDNWHYSRDTCDYSTCSEGDHKLLFYKRVGGIYGHTYCAFINIVTIESISNVDIILAECFFD